MGFDNYLGGGPQAAQEMAYSKRHTLHTSMDSRAQLKQRLLGEK